MIKFKKIHGAVSLAIACLLLAAGLAVCCTMPARAGVYEETLVDDSSINGMIDSAYWWQPVSNPGVIYEGGIHFTDSSTATSRLVSSERIYNLKEAGYEKCFSTEFTFTIGNIPDGTRFGLFFGLSRQTASPAAGGADTSFIYFEKRGYSVYCGVSNFVGDAREEREVLPAADTLDFIPSSGTAFSVHAEVDVNGGIAIELSQEGGAEGEVFFSNAQAACYTEGNIGFGQIGAGSDVTITHVQIDALSNETPENTNIVTGFESGVFNINELYTNNSLYSGASSYIRPENGALVFHNTKNAYLSTRLSYSNFRLEVEIPYMQRTPVFDSDFNLTTSICTGFYLTVGGVYNSGKLDDSAFYVHFAPENGSAARVSDATVVTVYSNGNERMRVVLPEAYHIWSDRIVGDRSVIVAATMDDGVFTLQLRYGGDLNYYTVLEYDAGRSHSGSIQIVSSVTDFVTAVCDNFSIGTISVVNTDYNRRVVLQDNRDNNSLVYDYEYYDTWDDGDLLKGE